jgi:hypothetical protein
MMPADSGDFQGIEQRFAFDRFAGSVRFDDMHVKDSFLCVKSHPQIE